MQAKPEGQHLSNGERMDDATAPDMDDAPMAHLLAWWVEIGPARETGMGMEPIAWGDIEAWTHTAGVPLSPWECGLMRTLSRAYIGHFYASTKEGAISPLLPPPTRQQAANKIKGVFSQLKSRKR